MTTLTWVIAAITAALPVLRTVGRRLLAAHGKYRVHIERDSRRRVIEVGLKRWHQSGFEAIVVALVDLAAEDADEQLVAAKMEAATKARLLNGMRS